MDKPTVSVCIPVFNNQETIKSAIDSVLKQDYKDFEIIVSDNHSDDDTCEIVKKIGEKRIKLYQNKENIGWRLNSSRAFELASGEYIVTLHANTMFKKGYLKRVAELFEKNPSVGIIHFISEEQKRRYFKNRELMKADDYYSAIANLRVVPPPTETAYRREAIMGTGYYEKDYWTCEARLGMNIAKKGYDVLIVGETYVDYSLETKKKDSQRVENLMMMFDNTYNFFNEFKNDKKINKQDAYYLKGSVINAFLFLYRCYLDNHNKLLKKAISNAERRITNNKEFRHAKTRIFIGKLEMHIRRIIKRALTTIRKAASH